ncbi:MAG: PqqD family protein [Halioglobus sp.]
MNPANMDPQNMNLNQHISLSPDVISQEVSGETVLLDLESENYFGLDAIGTRIWQLIKETNELQSIFDTLLEEYDVSEERLRVDITNLLTEIEGLGLVKLEARV